MARVPAIVVLLAAWPLALANAQGTMVSPPQQTTADDLSFWSAMPLLHDTPRRYLQIHSDLAGPAVALKKLAVRRDQTSPRGNGTRRVEVELYLGASVAWNQPSWQFQSNFTGPRTRVVPRRYLELPSLGSVAVPAAFELVLTFDVPWQYAGVGSFAWDMSLYSAQTTALYATRCDAYSASVTSNNSWQTGLGCYAATRTKPMLHTIALADSGGALSFAGTVDSAPAVSPCSLMLGLANPNQTVPGLCSPLFTDMLLSLPIGTTDANGYLGELQYGNKAPGGAFAFAVPNLFPGATIFSQVHALDFPSSWPIQLANSDGRAWTTPLPDLTRQNRVSRVYNDDAQPNGTRAVYVADGNVGFGAVVQFTY